MSVKTLADGTEVFFLANLLFDHMAKVDAALRKVNIQPRRFGPLGQPLGEENGENIYLSPCEETREAKWDKENND